MVFKQLEPSSILVTPFNVYKNHVLNSNDTGSISYYQGQYYNGNFSQAQIQNFKKTNGNFYEFIIHQSINSLYDDLYLTGQEKVLYENVQVISIPQSKFGEGVKKSSISLSIDIPDKNYQYVWNNSFDINTQPIYSATPTATTDFDWYYSGVGGGNVTASISNSLLTISSSFNTTDTISVIQKISANTLLSGSYLLHLDINSILNTQPLTTITLETYQSSTTETYTTDIDLTNSTYEYEFKNILVNEDLYLLVQIPYSGPTTFIFSDISLYKDVTHNLRDDGKGNIYDVAYSQSSAALKTELDSHRLAEWNFRNGYQKKDKNLNHIYTKDYSKYENNALCNNITFVDGLYSTKAAFITNTYKTVDTITVLLQDQSGNVIEQDLNMQMNLPNSYLRVANNTDQNSYNFGRATDFAISGLLDFANYGSGSIIPVPPESGTILTLTFDDINNAPAQTLSGWNAFFDTTTYADLPFNGMTISGSSVLLSGPITLNLKPGLFNGFNHIMKISDDGMIYSVLSYAFYGCNITDIILPICTLIDISAFQTTPIQNINAPSCVQIGQFAFENCQSLVNVTFLSCTTIGDSAFKSDFFLQTALFPVCTTILDYAFMNDTGLAIINASSAILIGHSAFENCQILSTVTLTSCAYAGSNSFKNCIALTTIDLSTCTNLGGTTGDDGVFANISSNTITLTIPTALNTDGDVLYLQANNNVAIINT